MNIRLLGAILLLPAFCAGQSFVDNQLKFERVAAAQSLFKSKIDSLCAKYALNNYQILLQVFKEEQLLEIWAKNISDAQYQKIETIEICEKSGDLGPKSKRGDLQTPEGFYTISRYNPQSSFYLSLGITYPNNADRKRSKASNLGGDIFIHGDCVTIGCVPIRNNNISLLYLLAIQSFGNSSAEIPVYIFPFKMTKENMAEMSKYYPQHIPFWENLKVGYDLFFERPEALEFEVDATGGYVFGG